MNQHTKQTRQRWKISAAEAMAMPVLVPGAEWHPLDGGAAPEYIPPQWDGPHVGLRLIDGFKTLLSLPSSGASGGASGYWPEYWHDWADMLAQNESDASEKDERVRAQNRTRMRPSAQDVSHMETSISWSAKYLAMQIGQTIWRQNRLLMLAHTVQSVAVLRVREHDLEYIARKLKRGPRELRYANREGLDLIATGLRRDSAAVF